MSSLSAASLDHARALLRQFPLIDGHNDLPWVVHSTKTAGMSLKNYDLSRLHAETDTDTPRLIKGQVAAQFFAAFVPTLADKPGRMTLELIDMIRQIPEAWPESYALRPLPLKSNVPFAPAKLPCLQPLKAEPDWKTLWRRFVCGMPPVSDS